MLSKSWGYSSRIVRVSIVFRGHKRSFLSLPPALPCIKGLGGTKTHDKTFAVLGEF